MKYGQAYIESEMVAPGFTLQRKLQVKKYLLTFFLIALGACAMQPVAVAEDNQPWLQTLIASIQQQPVANPPATIKRYTYHGALVYYLAARCCDIPSKLYDSNGTVICEPDGGITGKGDGRCPDFLTSRTDEKLIWKDGRSG